MRLSPTWLLTCAAIALCAAPDAASAKQSATVAVLYFDNNTGDQSYDVLQKGLADMLVTDLAAVDALEVVEREKLEQIVGELKLQRSRYFDPRTAQKIGKLIGARYAVTGSLAALSPTMRIDIRLVEVQTARVVMADKVVGKRDAFFDLQQQLVAKFVRGLNVRGVTPSATRVDDVDILLQYSQGIDKADRGDLKGATAALRQVVRAAPRFTLAQHKYAAIQRKLAAAGQRRDRALSDTEAALLAAIKAELARDFAKLPDDKAANRYLGYRVARGQHLLWQIKQLATEPEHGVRTAWIPAAKRAEAKRLMKAYFANIEEFIAELAIARKRSWRYRPQIEREDARRGAQLGISTRLGEWSFASPNRVSRALAQWAMLGEAPFWANFRSLVRPALVEVDPAYIRRSVALLDNARADIKAHEAPERVSKAMAEVTDTHAEGLIRLGKIEKAIAVWQAYLDRYPKGEKYKEFEGKIEALLGLSDKAQAYQASLATCEVDLASTAHEELARVRRAQGAVGVDRMLQAAIKTCRGEMTKLGIVISMHYLAALDAVENGECKRFKKIRASAAQVAPSPAYLGNFKQLGVMCQ